MWARKVCFPRMIFWCIRKRKPRKKIRRSKMDLVRNEKEDTGLKFVYAIPPTIDSYGLRRHPEAVWKVFEGFEVSLTITLRYRFPRIKGYTLSRSILLRNLASFTTDPIIKGIGFSVHVASCVTWKAGRDSGSSESSSSWPPRVFFVAALSACGCNILARLFFENPYEYFGSRH